MTDGMGSATERDGVLEAEHRAEPGLGERPGPDATPRTLA